MIHGRKWLVMLCCLFAASLPVSAHAYNVSIFGSREVRSTNLKPFPKWNGVLSRYFSQRDSYKSTECGKTPYNPCTLNEWRKFLAGEMNKPILEKLQAVNKYANTHTYITDPINWGVKDYWATPYEFSAKDGDCEDYAIAKFVSLRAIGVPNDSMRIMILQDMNLGGILHAILVVYADGQSWVLDNQIKQVMAASKIYHYKPIYSINETAWWRH